MAKKADSKKIAVENLNFTTVQANYTEHDFENNPVFMGMFIETVKLGEGEKEFEAHVFQPFEADELVLINKYYAIDKTLEKVLEDNDPEDVMFRFEFIEKTEVAGKPFRKFATQYAILPKE